MIAEVKDLQTHLGKNKVIIFDEFYAALTETVMVCKGTRALNPIFHMGGPKDQVVLMSGHNSLQFEDFLQQHYGSSLELQINKSVPEIFGFPAQEYRPTLSLCADMQTVRANAISLAKELVENGRAVFTIGLNWQESEMATIRKKDTIGAQINEHDDLALVQDRLCRFKKGVMSLPDSLKIGVDLRFDGDAYVILVSETIPKAENVR